MAPIVMRKVTARTVSEMMADFVSFFPGIYKKNFRESHEHNKEIITCARLFQDYTQIDRDELFRQR